MDESKEPLLFKKSHTLKSERKSSGNISDSLNIKTIFNLDDYKEKDPKTKKIEAKFIFKVFLHILCQVILILIMIIFSFKIKAINNIINNYILLFILSLITIILFFHPIFSDKILRISPYNYIYLFIFTICLSYLISSLFIIFNYSPNQIKVGGILLICELIGLLVYSYINKGDEINLNYGTSFMALCLLFFSSIIYFFGKIGIFKLILIILFILIIGIYLIYDINQIFLETRKTFEETNYALATMFIYIDIIYTLNELINKFYSSCEPEQKSQTKNNFKKNMIFTGEEEYQKLYNQIEEDENKENDKNDDEIKKLINPKKRNSDSNIKRFKVNKTPKEYDSEKDDDEK